MCFNRFLNLRRHQVVRAASRALVHLHYLRRLGALAQNALDLERRAAGFVGDLAVLLDQVAERGRIVLRVGHECGRHAPVGALRAVLVDHVEEHEFALRIAAWLFRHVGHPLKRKTPRRGAGVFGCGLYKDSGRGMQSRRVPRALTKRLAEAGVGG